jgi:hypothetical protein
MAIIGISGKAQSGKDTVAKIIQYLIYQNILLQCNQHLVSFDKFLELDIIHRRSSWEIHKFADALKDIVCILTNCTREQLDNTEFKETKYFGFEDKWLGTIRGVLQYIGTDLIRNNLGENIWINLLFHKYTVINVGEIFNYLAPLYPSISVISNPMPKEIYPNWIIPDCRFENEVKAIKDRNGIIIRCNKTFNFKSETWDKSCPCCGTKNNFELFEIEGSCKWAFSCKGNTCKSRWTLTIGDGGQGDYIDNIQNHYIPHSSETSLDNYPFDYEINNNGTIEELIKQVKEILIKEKLL